MAIYRNSHIKPNTIAMVPVHGYLNKTNFSRDSIRWLDYVATTQGISIQHAFNGTGERKIGGISVDGFCEETKTIYQFQVTFTLYLTVFFLILCLTIYLMYMHFLFFLGLFLPWL